MPRSKSEINAADRRRTAEHLLCAMLEGGAHAAGARHAIDHVTPARHRRLLHAVFDSVTSRPRSLRAIAGTLADYADNLRLKGEFEPATRVYAVSARWGEATDDYGHVAYCWQHRGSCYRELGQPTEAERSYSTGLRAAANANPLSSLRIRIAQAILYRGQGRWDEADAILTDVADTAARLPAAEEVLAYALNDRGIVAFEHGDPIGACRLLLRAYRILAEPAWRLRVRVDIGRALSALGLYGSARAALLLVYCHRSSEQLYRSMAAINLLDIAIATCNEVMFEQWLRELDEGDELPDRLRMWLQLHRAEGLMVFGRAPEIGDCIREARTLAEQMGARSALAQLDSLVRGDIPPRVAHPVALPPEVCELADLMRATGDVPSLIRLSTRRRPGRPLASAS